MITPQLFSWQTKLNLSLILAVNHTAIGPEYRLFIALGNFCESEVFFLLVREPEVGGGQSLFSHRWGDLLPVKGDIKSSLQPILSLPTLAGIGHFRNSSGAKALLSGLLKS